MKGILFLFWFLVLLLTVVLGLENPTPTTDWHNSSPDDSHQKESLVNGWFKYLSGHWGRKLHYGCTTTPPPPVEPLLVRPNTSFYLLTYLVGYYLFGWFSSTMGRFAYLGIEGLNIGALAHQFGNLFPIKWAPDSGPPKDDKSCSSKGELVFSHSNPANERFSRKVSTKGCQTLVDGATWPKENHKIFPMADGHTYTLGHQEVAHCYS
ncbi:hypothetical protein DSO57_1021543 [Entomophthora muscae]|uniref:Uncharacterized protein n=1 Tax=Entomophthora muscae TaxID=34485 RepID=A0ACC2SGB1_9FUNG|nr:hypothetical protein DSO57_1021543 [Entomophthora muscae]